MKIVDLHQDLMTHVRFKERLGQIEQTSFESIEDSPIHLVIATAFPFPNDEDQTNPVTPALITEELEMYRTEVKQRGWHLMSTADDLLVQGQKILLHIEGLNVFDGSSTSWQQLKTWYKLGIRSVGTHWNIDNQLGGGTNSPQTGLTELGYEVLDYLERESFVIDLAHMSRQGFYEAAKLSKRPLYVSHGNADSVFSSVRNYTDEQLRMIGQSGGIIGVFFAQSFITGKEKKSTMRDVLTHIAHIYNVAGEDAVAIGSDFGGIVSGGVEGLQSVYDLESLVHELRNLGYTTGFIEKITHKNALRVLTEHLS